MHMKPFVDILVPYAGGRLLTPGQAGILNPGIGVSGTATGTHKEYIVFPELDIIPAGDTLLHTDIPGLEIGWVHSGASFLH
jgi:hypothetical protein